MPKILTLGGGSATGTVTAPVALTTGVLPKASGASTLTDSAITEATTTLTSTKRLLLPAGSTNTPGLDFAADAGTGIFDNAPTLTIVSSGAGVVAGFGSSSVPSVTVPSNGSFGFSANSNLGNIGDTALSRSSANIAQLGVSGGGLDASGTLNLARINVGTVDTLSGSLTIATGDGFSSITLAPGGNTVLTCTNNGAALQTGVKFNNYNNINLVDNGLVSEVGHLDLTAQAAAISATTIFTPTATGRFRISVYEKVTTAASVSSVLGGGTGTVLTYTDGTDSVAQSIVMGLDNQAGTLALFNNGNSTTTNLNGTAYIYALTGVPIQIAVGYTSSGTAMAFAVRATCEAL